MLELLINKDANKTTILLLKNGILIEKHEEYETKKRLEGNIYIGKVQNVVQGMESAFVDIGESRNTFIRLKDLLPKENETVVGTHNCALKEQTNIKDIVKPGQYITLQVRKDGTENKGARVSTHINLSGRFTVYMPNSNFITVSQKIEDEKERQRLIQVVKKILPKDTGAIIRTSAKGKTDEILSKDLKELIKKWEKIVGAHDCAQFKKPKLIYDNRALLRRTVIDIIDARIN